MTTRKKQSAVARKILGKDEPTFDCLSSDNIDLIRALNYYAIHKTYEDSKIYALEWASANFSEMGAVLAKATPLEIKNTGFVCRIIDNGYTDEDLVQWVRDEFRRIETMVKTRKEAPKVEKVKLPVVKRAEPNVMLEQFDYAIDSIVSGVKQDEINFTDNRKHLGELDAAAKKLQVEVFETPDQFNHVKELKVYLRTLIAKIETVTKSVKSSATRKAKPRKIDPAKMTANLVLASSDNELGCKTLKATSIIGATKLVVWHPERRTLTVFIASNENGFLVSGRSLKNFDVEKSITKKIRKPADMWKEIKDMTATRMHYWLRDTCKTTETPAKALIADGSIILKV